MNDCSIFKTSSRHLLPRRAVRLGIVEAGVSIRYSEEYYDAVYECR